MENNEKKVATIFDYARICRSLSCCECPLCVNNNGYDMVCNAFITNFPDEANDMILTWVEEEEKKNRVKTYKDDFYEKFPKAPKYEGKHPDVCRIHLYGGECNYSIYKCEACWNQPYEESEDKE